MPLNTLLRPHRVALFLSAFTACAHAASPDLTNLHQFLGRSRMEVIQHLEGSELSCVSSESESTIEKCKVISVEGTNPETRRALLYFADDRLARVQRIVSTGSPTSETQAIVSALTSLLAKQADGRYEVAFSNESGSNGARLQRIRFHSSERTITLNYIFGVRDNEGRPVPPLLQIDESQE